MTELEAIETRIRNLPPEGFKTLSHWFHEFENELWDQKIASDFKAGKFNKLIAKAQTEFSQGKAREI